MASTPGRTSASGSEHTSNSESPSPGGAPGGAPAATGHPRQRRCRRWCRGRDCEHFLHYQIKYEDPYRHEIRPHEMLGQHPPMGAYLAEPLSFAEARALIDSFHDASA